MALTTPRPCTMIDSLTTAQEARFPEFVERWTRIGLCTEPANHAEAERGIVLAYQQAKLPPPRVVWCGSPLSMALTRSFILQCLASVGDSVWASVGASVYGNHDASWLAFYKFFKDECGLEEQTSKLEGLWLLSKCAGWALPHENICWVSERHCILERDSRGRLHNLSGPACAYPDGWAIYAIHGVRVPEWIITTPADITVEKITVASNAEIRRVMIQLFGTARYLRESGAQCTHELPDNYYVRGLQGAKLYLQRRPEDSDIVMVAVKNSTPEPDGSVKDYWLRVQPTAYDGEAARNCHAAIASTWRNQDGSLYFDDWRKYAPGFES